MRAVGSIMSGVWLKTAAMLQLLLLAGCSGYGPSIGDNDTVYTPVYQDNRVYFLKSSKATPGVQPLVPLSQGDKDDPDNIPRNSPLSIILRSVEIPSAAPTLVNGKSFDSPVEKPGDYAVILDIGTASSGETQSIVVWYQRGVYPDQSLNFSNLLVYFEPRWDERIAPLFRVRVIEVTKEKNEETRRMLEQAHSLVNSGATVLANPAAEPMIGLAFAAANMVLGNRQNRALVDYTVQLYSSNSAQAAGSSQLGVLKRGSYIVVGKPSEEGRDFWADNYTYDVESRILKNGQEKRVNVPTALISVGTFDSIVPKSVLERSATLSKLLAQNGKDSSIEQINSSAKSLQIGVEAFSLAEKLTRYRDSSDVKTILQKLKTDDYKNNLGVDDKFNLLSVISKCYGQKSVFTQEEAEAFYEKNPAQPCK